MNSRDLEVYYEDNHLLVVYKPCNILSQSDVTGDVDLLSVVKDYVKEKYQKPGNVYIGLVHRLDRPTCGLMVFARTSKAASRLFRQIQNHEFEKEYVAVVHGILEEKTGKFVDYLEKKDNMSVVSSSGKLAELSYRVISEDLEKQLSLVLVFLKTGRHHQIRVQFASRGYPLYGDQKYGKLDKKQLCLAAFRLSFYHPTTKERLNFQLSSLPKLEGFENFNEKSKL